MAVTMIEQQPGCGPPAPVPILQWEKEFEVLLELYRRMEPTNVLEIGTYHGGTLYHWLRNSRSPMTIVSVDSYAVGVNNRHMYEDWNENMSNLVVLKGDSHGEITSELVESYGPYDFVFIDAGHFLPEVTKDWQLYRPMVRPGGLMCFHDILTHPAWPSIEVGRLWAEIKKDHLTFEIVADRNAEWGGVGVVML